MNANAAETLEADRKEIAFLKLKKDCDHKQTLLWLAYDDKRYLRKQKESLQAEVADLKEKLDESYVTLNNFQEANEERNQLVGMLKKAEEERDHLREMLNRSEEESEYHYQMSKKVFMVCFHDENVKYWLYFVFFVISVLMFLLVLLIMKAFF